MKNWNKILRWTHFVAGLSVSYYFFFMPDEGWSNGTNNLYKLGIVSFLFWSGIIRWNLPRIRKWNKGRTASA